MLYPGLASHPQHALFHQMANPGYGAGGLLTLDLGTTDRANRLMECLQNDMGFGLMAVSLGCAHTCSRPCTTCSIVRCYLVISRLLEAITDFLNVPGEFRDCI